VEKYRPKALDELIAHEEIITILNKLIETNKLPHLLFHGPPGTGKTSTILACARKMYGDSFKSMVLELNASDDRGIDVVRDQIKEFAGTKKLFSSGVKLVILDEADAMTNDAQSALRRVVEKYTTNTRFCMICNYVNKIIPALQSRCTRFRFAPLRADQITGRLQDVVDAERVVITEGGKTALLQLAGGDLRRVLNLLQSAAMAYPEITEEAVYLTAGAAMPAVIESTFQSLLNDDFDTAYKKLLSVRMRTAPPSLPCCCSFFLSPHLTALAGFFAALCSSQANIEFGYALCDIITELAQLVTQTMLPDAAEAFLVDRLSTLEHRLSHGVNEKLQLGALVGAFVVARSMLTP